MSAWHGDEHRDRIPVAQRQPPRRPAAPQNPLAPIEQRDMVNHALVAELGLTDAHCRHLLEVRGLPLDALDGFASSPGLSLADDRARRHLADRVADRAGCGVAGTPGFYCDQFRSSVPMVPGILIPIPDAAGRLQGFQLRADDAAPGERRYTTVSSRNYSRGCSPSVPASTWCPALPSKRVWAIEAHFKAVITAHRLGVCTLGMAGVSNWRPVVGALGDLGSVECVVVAYDAPDMATNPDALRAREAFAGTLHRAGYGVEVATWDGTRAKGIDDALLGGVAIDVAPWRPIAQRPACLILPPLSRRAGEPLACAPCP